MTNHVSAASWRFTPSAALSEAYYSNIRLSQTSSEGEFVSKITPAFSLDATGRRLQLNSQYSLSYIDYWKNIYTDRFNHRGSLGANWEAIKKHLFVNASANISQQVIDPTVAAALNSQINTNNQTETRSLSLNPVLRNRFGRYADSLLSYEFSQTNTVSTQVGVFQQSAVNYTLSSGQWFNKLTWFGNTSIQQSQQNNADGYQVNARVDYRLIKQWSLFATAQMSRTGYINQQISNSLYYMTADAGIVWTPSRKISMELGAGGEIDADALRNDNQLTFKRPIWRGKVTLKPTARTIFELGREQANYGRRIYSTLSHYTRKTTWSSTYAETLTTPQQLRHLSGGGDQLGSLGQNNSFGFLELNRAVTDDVILRKRFDANGKIKRRKLTLTGNVFHEKGEYQTSQQTDKRYGAGAGLEINLSRRLTAQSNCNLQRYYFNDLNRIDNIYSIDANLTRKLGKKTNASLSYLWQKRSASKGGVNYITNQITAEISIIF